ncbi:hypothetical protein [Brevibacillus sp. AY1]|uniref:hypothetical protein n=1 Tax=Brevibacillus sp. AY1 TaxID=2807621 RepID=UPI002455732C|nr:hypothetical protein [Brevibacillus sp. AY1]MDH4617998.1 hypothetical protein [Brevibacillus sp. AY1]
MNKKLVLSVLSTALVASMASAAMAKPSAGIYIGGDVDKYYSAIPFLDNFDAALDEILDNLEDSVFVDPNGNAAKLSDALSADDINTVLKPATEADFEANDYKVVGEEGKVWNPKDWTPEVPGELKVESVSAINANSIKVTFNKAVEDTSKVTFTVKQGLATITVNAATWNEAKTEATLAKASGVFAAGEYTVTAAGVDGIKDATKTVKFDAQAVDKIEIVGDNAVKAANGQTATFSYKVLDQYGTDITKTTDLTATASEGVAVQLDKVKGLGTLTADFTATNAPKTVVVTLVDAKTGKNSFKTLNIAASATVDTLTLGDVTYPKDVTRLYAGSAEAGYLAYTAADQYGNAITEPAALNSALELVSSDANVKFSFVKKDEKAYINIDTTGLATAKKVTLTVVNKKTGNPVVKQLDIVATAAPDAISFGALSKEVVSVNDTVYMDIVVTDQFGTQLAPKDYAGKDLKITATGGLAGQVNVVTDKTDAKYGKLKLTPTSKGKATIVSTLGDKVVSTVVDVQDTRVLSEVVAAPNQNVIQGAEATLKFGFKDQYGAAIEKAANTADMSYNITVTKVDGDEGAVTVISPTLTGANEVDLNNVKVKAAAGKTGSAKVKVELIGKDGKTVVSSAETTVKVTANNAEGLNYSVVALPALVADTAHFVNGTDAYAAPVKVEATTADGTKVAVNPEQIVKVEVVNGNGYFEASNAVVAEAEGNVDAQEGYFVVAAAKKADDKAPTNAKVRVTVNTADGLKVLEAPITFTSEAPEVKEVMIADQAADIDTPTELPEDTKAVTEVEFKDLADAANGVDNVFVNVKDQYGVWSTVDADFIVNTPNLIDLGEGNKFATADGVFSLTSTEGADVVKYAEDKAIKLSTLQGTVAKTLTVTFTDAYFALTAEDFGDHSDDVNEYSVGFNVKGANASDLSEVEVTLYDKDGNELATNTAKDGLFKLVLDEKAQLSSPFDVQGVFTDDIWNYGKWATGKETVKPAKAVITVTDKFGNTFTKENTNFTGK